LIASDSHFNATFAQSITLANASLLMLISIDTLTILFDS